MTTNELKQNQERLTFEDTKAYQKLLREYIEGKLSNPLVTSSDRQILPGLLSNSLMSQPALSGLHPSIEIKGLHIQLAANVEEFLSMLLRARSYRSPHSGKRYIKVGFHGKSYYLELAVLWGKLLTYVNRLCASAVAESLSRSKEREVHEGMSEVPMGKKG